MSAVKMRLLVLRAEVFNKLMMGSHRQRERKIDGKTQASYRNRN